MSVKVERTENGVAIEGTPEEVGSALERSSAWLQAGLRGYVADLEEALRAPIPAEWPKDESYLEARPPAELADVLMRAGLHEHLVNAKIAYVWRKDQRSAGRVRLGKASKASSKIQFLTGYDFIIEFNWTAWRDVLRRDEQRVAIVDHELCHCARDDETGKWTIRHHDVEEFGEIVRRWGLWKEDLRIFGMEVSQLDLFSGPGA